MLLITSTYKIRYTGRLFSYYFKFLRMLRHSTKPNYYLKLLSQSLLFFFNIWLIEWLWVRSVRHWHKTYKCSYLVPFLNVILLLSEEIENCLNEIRFWHWIWIEYLLYWKHLLVKTFRIQGDNRIRIWDCRYIPERFMIMSRLIILTERQYDPKMHHYSP